MIITTAAIYPNLVGAGELLKGFEQGILQADQCLGFFVVVVVILFYFRLFLKQSL